MRCGSEKRGVGTREEGKGTLEVKAPGGGATAEACWNRLVFLGRKEKTHYSTP